MRRVLFAPGRWFGRRSRLQLGLMWLAVTLLAGWALFNKAEILVALRSGDTITADFVSRYKLKANSSKVEVAGVRVGTVTGVEDRPGGGARVEMKLDDGITEKLGRKPEAAIRPATLLGGPGLSAYVELTPGGGDGPFEAASIPAEQTRIPVELDRVLEVLTEEARRGMVTSNRGLDTALQNGGGPALAGVLEHAPPALGPAAEVLGGLPGTEPGDLARLVDDLGKLAAAATGHAEGHPGTPGDDGELEAVVDGLAAFASTLGDRAGDMEAATASMPATLDATRQGLHRLEGTLARLEATAPATRPGIQRLEELLERAQPVLAEAHPVLADLRPVAAEAKPVVDTLAPTTALFREFLDDLDGPVLDRINDPVIPTLRSPYRGSTTLLYEEIAYLQAGLAGIMKYTDPSGATMNFNIGNNGRTLADPPVPLPEGSGGRAR